MAYLDREGVQIYYEVTGTGDPIVLIHGLGSSTRDWEPQVSYFAPRYQVVTVDLRGHGRSARPPGPYSIALFAADVAAVIKTLGIAPAHIVGISLGGMVAFQLAVSDPACVRSLVIVNSGPEFAVMGDAGRQEVEQRIQVVRAMGMRAMGEALAPRLFPKEDQAELRQVFVERWAENDPQAYCDALGAFIGWSVSDHLDAIQCPVLAISADQDYTPVAMKEAYVARLANAKLVVIEDSRHAVSLEQAQAFNEAVETFLAQVP